MDGVSDEYGRFSWLVQRGVSARIGPSDGEGMGGNTTFCAGPVSCPISMPHSMSHSQGDLWDERKYEGGIFEKVCPNIGVVRNSDP